MSADRVARGYDGLARGYDLLARAVYGNALRKAQSCFLSEIGKQSRVLVLGGGSGWFLEQLLRQANPAQVVYVELSPNMLDSARTRIARKLPSHLNRVEFVLGRAEDYASDAPFDWIVTHCLLDMFAAPSLERLLVQLKAQLRPDGQWYFSDFAHPQRQPMRVVAALLIWLMYRFFRTLCQIEARQLPDFDGGFSKVGMKTVETQSFFAGMIVAKRLSAMAVGEALK